MSTDSKDRSLMDSFPSLRWVFPEAPLRSVAAFPLDRIHQWFDVWNVSDLMEREDLQAEGLRESVNAIRRLIHSEAVTLGGRYDRIVLAGISQGAATSVHTLLNLRVPSESSPRRLAALMTFSARMPFPGRNLTETRAVLGLDDIPSQSDGSDGDGDGDVLRNTPVLMEHCANDNIVPLKLGENLRETLRNFGMDVSWHDYPDGGHWFHSPNGIDDAVTFLEANLGLSRVGNGI